MVKVRFLNAAFVISVNKTYNFNDETELSEEVAEILKKKGFVDILAEKVEIVAPVIEKIEEVAQVEAPEKKPAKRAKKATAE